MINKYIILVLSISFLHESSGQNNDGGGSQRRLTIPSLEELLRQKPTGFGLPRSSDVSIEIPVGDVSDAAILSNTNSDNLDLNNGVADGFGEPGLIEPNPSILSDPIQDGFATSPENSANVSQESLRSTATAGSFGPGSGKTQRRRRKRPRKQPKPRKVTLRPVDIHIDASVGATHAHDHQTALGNNPDNTVASVSVTMTDVHGNKPPSPSGVHIDLPGEHGNMNDFPVVHSGENVILSDAGMVDFNPGSSLVKSDTAGTAVDIPVELAVPTEISMGTDVPVLNEVASGIQTAVRVDQTDPMQSKNIFHASNVHNILPDALPTSGEFVDLAAIGDFGVGLDTTNPTAAKPSNLPNSVLISNTPISMSDGFVSQGDGFVSTSLETNVIHNDIPKTIESVTKVVNDGLDDTGIAKVHVDLPGEHGNSHDGIPLIHRDSPSFISPVASNTHDGTMGTPIGASLGRVHVDMPGEHGNPVDGTPVIHRAEPPHFGSRPVNNGAVPAMGTHLGNVHVDMPGEHGNPIGGAPVIHREEQPHFGSHPVDNGAVSAMGTPLGNVHADMPGEHGNPIGGAPVIHREELPPFGSHPLDSGATPGQTVGTHLGNVHIDMPGEHGNPIDGVPVVHRDGPWSVPNGPMIDAHLGAPIEAPLGSVHVDMPGEHGNPINGAPVVHRSGQNVDIHVDHDHGIHIDAPGQHGNSMNEPALHLPPGATIADARAAGVLPGITNGGSIFTSGVIPGKTNVPLPVAGHDSTVHVDMSLQHNNPFNGLPLIHPEKHPNVGPNIGPHNSIPGIHIDAPGEHGNTHDEPALHLPPGATIADATAAGIIPNIPTGGPVVPTGVLPGTVNVPVPTKPDHNILVPHVPKKRPSLGDILGLQTTTLPGKHNTLGKLMPSSPVDVLLNYGRDTRSRGPWKGRRKGGRRWGRRRGGRGGRRGKGKWKKDFHDDHFHPETTTTTTTTTTTPAPKSKPGNGITIIRSSRPNPFGNLGNVLRSALTGGGSGGGGLLGSLLQTALGSIGGGGGFRGFGPAPGPVMMIPGRRPMFGGIFQG